MDRLAPRPGDWTERHTGSRDRRASRRLALPATGPRRRRPYRGHVPAFVPAAMKRQKILQISSYPPPRAGWAVRVEFLKRQLEAEGHDCVVLNIGTSRFIPSDEYETVLSGADYVRKVWRFCRRGFLPHVHVNGATLKGLVLSLVAQCISLLFGRRVILTFHAGVEQQFFPR